ncbi:hypothetical protein KGQ20_02195 [Catenulispora sp. NF23]|uniref:Uncharacterized protein n=1 Tax=Catenulispora pinistramenti TaxID=2705254 RepID=A0ABS5KIF0_9ACTN|nr:hypothetical protein [Catenulispora pinistramenti]MBS2531576.1 hypothetical protein [Catenulispora pinistramenti]MBS2546174.1 hypothetical protein [Catenulispora pinistramenti]
MSIEAIAVTGASATAVIAAVYEVIVKGGRHTRRIMHAVETIESHSAELLPNHGSSLRDQVDRIRDEQQRHTTALADHTETLAEVQRAVARVALVLAEHNTDPATPVPLPKSTP